MEAAVTQRAALERRRRAVEKALRFSETLADSERLLGIQSDKETGGAPLGVQSDKETDWQEGERARGGC